MISKFLKEYYLVLVIYLILPLSSYYMSLIRYVFNENSFPLTNKEIMSTCGIISFLVGCFFFFRMLARHGR